MSDYLIKAVYTHDDPKVDRRRRAAVVSTSGGVVTAIEEAISKMEIANVDPSDVIADYLEDIGSEDTSEGWSWIVYDNNGRWDFEWWPFDSEDPVTAESLRAWAEEATYSNGRPEQVTDAQHIENVQEFLYCIMGRWTWRRLEWTSESDLREELHTIYVEGDNGKPYSKMTVDELIRTIMEEVVEAQMDNYDAASKGKPFGIQSMVEADTQLWLDESLEEFFKREVRRKNE